MRPNEPSRAKAYFEHIKGSGNGRIFLEGLINSVTPDYESEFLEFKGAYELKASDSHVLELWAKNLSGFANSDGGVLIFGIDAPKGKPRSLSMVQHIEKMCERLKNTLPTLTEPPVQRVEIEAFPAEQDPSTGFIVCYIPSSPWRPHQARVSGQPGAYYIRVADNHVPCNHATLRALFAPQSVAQMQVLYSKQRAPGKMALALQLLNRGPATAREVFVRISFPNFDSNLSVERRLWEVQPACGGLGLVCQRSVHPNEQVAIAAIPFAQVDQNQMVHYCGGISRCQIWVSCLDQEPMHFEVKVENADVDNAFQPALFLD